MTLLFLMRSGMLNYQEAPRLRRIYAEVLCFSEYRSLTGGLSTVGCLEATKATEKIHNEGTK